MQRRILYWGVVLCMTATGLAASELVYVPKNPSFGGNPVNGTFLLENARAQDDFKDPDAIDPNLEKSPLEEFNESLQRAVLSRLASAVAGNVISSDGTLTPGTFETVDFIVEVRDIGDGKLQVITTEKSTGAVSSFEIQSTF